MSVKWAKSIPSFQQLSPSDQDLLLSSSWSQLFLLSLSQWSVNLDKEQLLRESFAPMNKQEELSDSLTELCEIVTRITQLRLDHTEYTCLKALVLFKPEVLNLKQHLQVTEKKLQALVNSMRILGGGSARSNSPDASGVLPGKASHKQ